MAACDECGSHQMKRRVVDDVTLEECGLCGHLQGDEMVIARLEERVDAEERGYDPLVYPLVKSLEMVPTFRVSAASVGRVETSEKAATNAHETERQLAERGGELQQTKEELARRVEELKAFEPLQRELGEGRSVSDT